jgi:hypothetical protein
MKTLNRIDLNTICGGATRADNVLDALNKRYGSQGVVSYMGNPTFTGTHNGVEHVKGEFETNALWGGDTQRAFSGNYNPSTKALSGLRTKVIMAE